MPESMLGEAVKKLVALPEEMLGTAYDLLVKISDPEWQEPAKRFLRKENPWAAVRQVASDLLKLVTTVSLSAIKTFKVSDHFKVDETDGVKIGWLDENFQRVFGNKVEQNVAKAKLRIHQLLKASKDLLIIAALGGEAVAETTLAQMFRMMKKQGHGQKGKLLVDGRANIFYIRADDGALWPVYCFWSADYAAWIVHAYPITYPREWDKGYRVVSR